MSLPKGKRPGELSVRTFFRENIRLLKGGRGLLRFELFYKLAAVGVLVPTALALLNLSIRMAGLTYLTDDNLGRYFSHPAGILFAVGLCVGWGLYNLVELSGLTLYFYAAGQGRRMAARQIFTAGFRCAVRLFRPRNLWMLPFLLAVVPLTIFPLILVYAATVQVPEVVTRYIQERWWLLLLVLAALFLLFFLSLRWVFSLCFFSIEGESFSQARRSSVELQKGRMPRVCGMLLLWQGALLAGGLLCYVAFLGAALLLSKAFVPGTMGMFFFIDLFQWCNLGLLLLGLCVAMPACSIAICQLYLSLKRVRKERAVPLRALSLPRGRALESRVKWGIGLTLLALSVLNVGYIFPSVSRGDFGMLEGFSTPLIIAHRGDSKGAPENTMAAFRLALENDADMIELDVQQLADGSLILLHDSSFRRTAGVSRNVWEVTLPEVQEMEVGSWYSADYAGEPVPTFEEALAFARENGLRLNVELKSTGREQGLEEQVAVLIREYGMTDACVITSQQYRLLKGIKEADPDLVTGYILSVAYGAFYDLEYADLFSLRNDFVTESMVRSLHDNGKRLYVWTVNDDADIERFADMHVDGIITDNVDLARRLVDAPATNDKLLDAFERFFTGDSFSQSAKRFWKFMFRR